ncbi:MAG: hypothetical protein ABI234_16470, partial [Ktedonobacteraceae bacterium]
VVTTFGRNDVVWNPSTGAVVYRFRDGAPTKSVSWSSDSKYIASANANGAVQVWNAHTGQVIFQQQTNGQGYAAWAPSGMVIAFSTNNGSGKDGNPFVEVWNVTTKTQIASYTGSVDGPLVWSPDGKEIASGNGGDNIAIWDATTGTLLYTFTQQGGFVLSLAWSPDSKYIVSGSSSVSSSTGGGSYARVWIA